MVDINVDVKSVNFHREIHNSEKKKTIKYLIKSRV